MSVFEKYSAQITEYLLKDQSEEEMKAFEQEIKSNPELAREVEIQKERLEDLEAMISYKEMMEEEEFEAANKKAKEILSERNKKAAPQSQGKKLNIKRQVFYATAAAIAMLIVAGSLFIKPSPDALYKKYYAPFEAASFIERNGNQSISMIAQGLVSYQKKEYQEAIAKLSSVDPSLLDGPSYFMLGMAYLGTEEYKNAAEIFENYMAQYSHLAIEAKWYLALSYLKLEKVNEASVLFQELSLIQTSYGKQAARINKKLKLD